MNIQYQQYVTPSRHTSGMFYYLLSTEDLSFYLTLLNDFYHNILYINHLKEYIINFWLNEKQPFFSHFANPVNNFTLIWSKRIVLRSFGIGGFFRTWRHAIIDIVYIVGYALSVFIYILVLFK